MTPNLISPMYVFEKLNPGRQASPAPSASGRPTSGQVRIQLSAVLIFVALLLAGMGALALT